MTARATPVFVNCRILCEVCQRPAPGARTIGRREVPRSRMMTAAVNAGWIILKSGEARCYHHRLTNQETSAWTPPRNSAR